VNPAAIRSHYQIPSTLQGDVPGNSQAVAEYEDQWYDPEDLNAFFVRNDLPVTPVQVVGFNNNTQGYDGGEAELDIRKSTNSSDSVPSGGSRSDGKRAEYIMGVGVAVPTWFISLQARGKLIINVIVILMGGFKGDGFLEWIILLLQWGDKGSLQVICYRM
jgi:hypothetical protein